MVVEPETSVKLLESVSVPVEVPKPGVNVPVPVNTTSPAMVPEPLNVPEVLVTATDTLSTPPERLNALPAAITQAGRLDTVPPVPIVSELPVPVPPMVKARFPLFHVA